MIVTHVVAGLAEANGGPSYSIPALCAALRMTGAEVRLRCVGEYRRRQLAVHTKSISTEHSPTRAALGLLRASGSLRRALMQDALDGAVLHAHGLWLMPNLYPAWAKRRQEGTPLVHSPRGMLAAPAMEFSKWKKLPFWYLFQRSALQAADCIHATALSEYEEIRALGLKNPIAVIPNGIDLPELVENRSNDFRGTGHRTILSLGRLHPKKSLDVLVHAWAQLEPRYPDWCVRIVGPSEGNYGKQLLDLVRSLGLRRLTIEGPAYGADKIANYRAASLFVLPTRNENFGIAVAEALAAEVPVICTKGAPWSGLDRERCGWWIDHGVEPLRRSLERAMVLDCLALGQMGVRGRAWMERDFGWDSVAKKMHAVYAWLSHEAPMPSSVYKD